MPLGPNCPQWLALDNRLTHVASVSGAQFAAVIDVGKCVWCSSPDVDIRLQFGAADRFYKAEIKPRENALRRGARVSLENTEGPDFYVAVSFASIYFLVIWFGDPRSLDSMSEYLRVELPIIETLTLALPPPDGPEANIGAKRARSLG